MDFRETNVDGAYNETYEWMLSSEEYLAWKKCTGGRLLIKGKAGCGKSTLMKHLFQREISTSTTGAAGDSHKPRPIICSFYFNGRGGPMEKSLEGMLRTILHQNVSQNPTTYRYLSRFHDDMKKAQDSRNHKVDWTGETLTKMFDIMMRSCTLPQLIFIDAVDEGEGFKVADTFSLLEKYTSLQPGEHHAAASIFLSSRPDNFVNHRKEWTTIDLANFNSEDIKTYTINRLDSMARACAGARYESLATELVSEILRKAEGVFLWVRLVVDEITEAMERYEDTDYIRSLLFTTPTNLWDRFGGILLRVEDRHRPNMKRLLQIVLAAQRPLSVEELIHAFRFSSPNPPRTLQEVWDVETAEQIREDMKRRLLLYCGGLVEVIKTSRLFVIRTSFDPGRKIEYELTTQVQFIHQSVKDYLNSKRIPEELFDIVGSSPLKDKGHELLARASLQYLQLPELVERFYSGTKELSDWYGRMSKELKQNFWAQLPVSNPFLLYSPLWIKHADEAIENANSNTSDGMSLKIMGVVFQTWKFFPHPYRTLYSHIYTNIEYNFKVPLSSLLVFSAHQGFAHLFR